MKCARSENYVRDGSREHLESLQDESLRDIHNSFGITPIFGIPTCELFDIRYRLFNRAPQSIILVNILPHRARSRLLLTGDRRVWEIGHLSWILRENEHITGPSTNRGIYLYMPAIILLHDGIWCRQVMIHETLHSTSLFSRIYNQYDKRWWRGQRNLREGTTECLTGYVLVKKHPDCYEGWKSNKFDRCSIAGYSENTKIWCSLCQMIGIRHLAAFYLSTDDNLGEPWNIFTQSIRDMGWDNFNYPLDINRSFSEPLFREMCVNTIPGFRETYDSLTDSLNFYKIP